jgi:hypothetical protein
MGTFSVRRTRARAEVELRASHDQSTRRRWAKLLLLCDQRLGELRPDAVERRAALVARELWGDKGAASRGFGSTPPAA